MSAEFLTWWFLAWVAVGWALGEWHERRLWRQAMQVLSPGAMSTTPPTVAELHRPSWTEDA